MLRTLVLALGLAGAISVGAVDQVWLIGGGPDVFSSQAQIEANVLWARRVIAGLPGQRVVHIWFGDGEDPAPDVTEWSAPEETRRSMQPLARVMDTHWSNGDSYRNHRIPKVEGSTEAEHLSADLVSAFQRLGEYDQGWLIFNGHGKQHKDFNNSIELWNRTWLYADELEALVNLAPARTRLRFLFTQCYAGAFTRLAVQGSERCGFVAEAADRQAEGCSAAIDTASFQDYSTHYFAALAGKNRDGRSLANDPDRDGDGRVSPLEAHYYTLLTADSSDIPRATSEALLEQWRPWYLPILLPVFDAEQNRYAALAQELMQAVGIVPGGDVEREIRLRRAQLETQRQSYEQSRGDLAQAIGDIRPWMENEVLRRWPRAAYPYTLNFQRFLEEDLEKAQTFILRHPEYQNLKGLQDTYWAQDEQLLDNERALTRLEKIEHLLQLSRVLATLRAIGPTELEQRFEQLLGCESEPF